MISVAVSAQEYPPTLPDARAEIYKTVGETALSLYIFESGSDPKSNRPAIVFFFGGSWSRGTPEMFAPHCRYLASRGMVAITADYRVATRQQVKPVACVADAKSAIRWLRRNAERLGIDPRRIAAGGGSAGGHIAAAAATLPEFDEPHEGTGISSVPDALVLFNPILVLAPLEGRELSGFGANKTPDKLGADPLALSPAHHVKPGTPATIILHGRGDKTVAFASVEAFADMMKAAGNRCELIGYDGQGHGFFNYGKSGGRYYRETLAAADAFLVSLGYLAPLSNSP
jgi:acetyl esterase